MNKYTIYIPTKGRATFITTAALLDAEHIDYKLVIEPQDAESYMHFFDEQKLIVMPEDNVGMAGVRRFIKRYSRSKNEEYHWQIDDNIKGFKKRIDNKNISSSANANITEIEQFVDEHANIGGAGMRHQMFAWTQKHRYTINQQCPSCVLFNNACKSDWRDDVIEDTDYWLQVLYEGYTTILFNRLVMDKTAIKTMPGGCTDLYYNNDNIRYSRQVKLQEYWPGIFDIKVVNGISRVKPSRIWQKFQQRPILKK